MRIHIVPGVNLRAAASDLRKTGLVAIDDIAERSWEELFSYIIDELGHDADELELRTQRIETRFGPVFVLREADRWTAAKAKKAVLDVRYPKEV
ncbi:MAG: hypothetical protein RBU37_21455 [Myxococcota bacterium]|jgi:hypothetical protein|nr:hypothetical protein [Myxococcota bacterium]